MAAGRAQYNFRAAPEWTGRIQDLSGRSVFYRNDAGEIFHTYSAYGRGGEEVMGIYGVLDAMPKGRNETGPYMLRSVDALRMARERARFAAAGIAENQRAGGSAGNVNVPPRGKLVAPRPRLKVPLTLQLAADEVIE